MAEVLAPLPESAPWWAKYLEANAHQFWQWSSVRLNFLWAALAAAYAADPAGVTKTVQDHIPSNWWPWIVLAASLLNIVARVTKKP